MCKTARALALIVFLSLTSLINVYAQDKDSVHVVILVDVSGSMMNSSESFIDSMKLLYALVCVNDVKVDFDFYLFAEGLNKDHYSVSAEKSSSLETKVRVDNFKNGLTDFMSDKVGGNTFLLESLQEFESLIIKDLEQNARVVLFSDMCSNGEEAIDDDYRKHDKKIAEMVAAWECDFKIIPWENTSVTPAKMADILKSHMEESIGLPQDDTARLSTYGRFLKLYYWMVYGYDNNSIIYEPRRAGTAPIIPEDVFSLLTVRLLNDNSNGHPDVKASNESYFTDNELNINMRYFYLPQPLQLSQDSRFDTDYICVTLLKPIVTKVSVSSEIGGKKNLRQNWDKSEWILLSSGNDAGFDRSKPIDLNLELKYPLEGAYVNVIPTLYLGDTPYPLSDGDETCFKGVELSTYPFEDLEVRFMLKDEILLTHKIKLKTKNNRPKLANRNAVYSFNEKINLDNVFRDIDGDKLEYAVEVNVDHKYDSDEHTLIVFSPDDNTEPKVIVTVSDPFNNIDGSDGTLKTELKFSNEATTSENQECKAKNSNISFSDLMQLILISMVIVTVILIVVYFVKRKSS